jgi:CRP-like cAMP-binding protein
MTSALGAITGLPSIVRILLEHASGFKTMNAVPLPFRIVKQTAAFDAEAFLRSAGLGISVAAYRPAEVVFSQGDPAASVLYIQEGAVRLSVLSERGKEAVVAILEPGDFFGESALAGRPARQEGAIAVTAATMVTIPKQQMIRLLHDHHALSDVFISHMLARNDRIQQDLIDHLCNSSEKRLARTLLLLVHYDRPGARSRVLSRISQQTLADMIGTTRPRVSFFMNKFKKCGFIEYNGGLKVNDSLVTVLLRDEPLGTGPRATG